MDYRQLEMFEAVYDTGSFSRAATQLYLTRQTLSSGLAALEKELGFALFKRTTTGSNPTEAAHILKRYCVRQRRLCDDCLDEMHREASRKIIRVAGSMPFMHPGLFEDIMRVKGPGSETEISFINSDKCSELAELLTNGEADMAGIWQIPDDDRLDPIFLFASYMSVLVGQESPLAQLPEVDYTKDLIGTSLLFISKETHARIAPNLETHAIESQIIEPNLALIKLLLDSGNTALPVPHHHVSSVQSSGMVERRITNYPLCSVTAVCAAKPRPALVERFIAKWRADGPLKESMRWEDYLRSGGKTETSTYMFLPPEEGSNAWDVPCPWFEGDYSCCAHCRQAHGRRS